MDGKKKWIANEFFRMFLTKHSITDGDGEKKGGGREGSRVMTEERKSSSAEGKVRETQADVRRRPRSILSAAVFDFLRGGGGERRKRNNNRQEGNTRMEAERSHQLSARIYANSEL